MHKEIADKIRELAEDIELFDPADFLNNEMIDDAVQGAVDRVSSNAQDAVSALPLNNLEKLKYDDLANLRTALSKLSEVFGKIQVLAETFKDAQHFVDIAIQLELDEWEQQYYAMILSVASQLQAIGTTQSRWDRLVHESAIKFQSDLHTKHEMAESIVQRMEVLLNDVADSTAKTKVANQSKHFLEESDDHTERAKSWLELSIWIFIAILLFAIFAVFAHELLPERPGTVYEWIQLGISKAIIFSVLVYAFIASIKNYNANIHNAVVNKHRSNALATYNALAEAARDIDKRDIILTKAAECIFDPQPTGFSKTEGGESAPVSIVSLTAGAAKSLTGEGSR